jgi:hypothetical protein
MPLTAPLSLADLIKRGDAAMAESVLLVAILHGLREDLTVEASFKAAQNETGAS